MEAIFIFCDAAGVGRCTLTARTCEPFTTGSGASRPTVGITSHLWPLLVAALLGSLPMLTLWLVGLLR
jgi:hypothetical protein